MKKLSIIAASVLLGGVLYAQTKQVVVPAAVKTAFSKKFPSATGVKWSKESASEFEAEFKNGGLEQAANFDASGNWIVTETELKTSQLPAAVSKTLAASFKGYKIEEAEKVETPGAALIYEVKAEKGELSYIVQLSPEGKIIKKEVEKEEKDKGGKKD